MPMSFFVLRQFKIGDVAALVGNTAGDPALPRHGPDRRSGGRTARWRASGQRILAESSRMGLRSETVTGRLKNLPEGSLRQAGLDTVLVTERTEGFQLIRRLAESQTGVRAFTQLLPGGGTKK
ncbi:hypothetical protein ACWD4V_18350 [Streptomyces tsukubensis]